MTVSWIEQGAYERFQRNLYCGQGCNVNISFTLMQLSYVRSGFCTEE